MSDKETKGAAMETKDTTRRIVLKKEFKEKKDLVMDWVDLSEFFGEGAGVYVRTLSAKGKDKYERSMLENRDPRSGKIDLDNARAKFAVYAACDANGDLIFSEEDIAWLGDKSNNIIQPIVDAAGKLNKMGDKELADSVKNLQKMDGEDSTSV